MLNNNGLTVEVKTGATVLSTYYDGAVTGTAPTSVLCVVADKYEPNDTRGAKAVLATTNTRGSIFPAGNDDWYAFPSTAYPNGLSVVLNDETTHQAKMDVYVDGALTQSATQCLFQPSSTSHTVEVRVVDPNATAYVVSTFNSTTSPC